MLRRETERMLACQKSPIFSFFSCIWLVRIMVSGETRRTDKAEFAPSIVAVIISK